MQASDLILPIILAFFGIYCVFSKKNVSESFVLGANEGLKGTFGILPSLVILMVSTAMFSASGASDILTRLSAPLFSRIGVPSELIPLIIIRPISGSGGTALLSDIFSRYGPDSFIGECASIMAGSGDTVFYVTALYMSSAGVRKTRYTIPCALTVMLLGIVLSCLLPKIL